MVFKNLCVLVLWTKVASAFEGLRYTDGYLLLKILGMQTVQSLTGMNMLWYVDAEKKDHPTS